jgi:hypothetical protein
MIYTVDRSCINSGMAYLTVFCHLADAQELADENCEQRNCRGMGRPIWLLAWLWFWGTCITVHETNMLVAQLNEECGFLPEIPWLCSLLCAYYWVFTKSYGERLLFRFRFIFKNTMQKKSYYVLSMWVHVICLYCLYYTTSKSARALQIIEWRSRR